MNHIKKFEAFIIPKPFRKKIWKDEDIAIKILNELKINGAPDLTFGVENNNKTFYFSLKYFNIKIQVYIVFTSRMYETSDLYLDDVQLDVSHEVCKKIWNILCKIEREPQEFIKKDFRKTKL